MPFLWAYIIFFCWAIVGASEGRPGRPVWPILWPALHVYWVHKAVRGVVDVRLLITRETQVLNRLGAAQVFTLACILLHHGMDFEVEINLKPEDVMVHLEQLGYHDISPLQLKEFIRDLKKLIKYDIKKQKENQTSSSTDTSRSVSSTPPSNSSCSMEQVDRKRKPLSQANDHSRWGMNSSGSTATSSSVSSSSSYSESSSNGRCSPMEEERPKFTQKRTAPSFIRPRDLDTPRGPPRHDPVALYHYYQKFWKTFKLPGEDEHRELRWNIRERMLGPSQSSARSTRSTPRSSCSTLNRL